VTALTDVTGFGLLGHASEMARASETTAAFDFSAIPFLPNVRHYLEAGALPGGARRNLASYGDHLGPMPDEVRLLLADPQTSGGLLVAVAPDHTADFEALGADEQAPVRAVRVGRMIPRPARSSAAPWVVLA
jgi:selenide,water dikinase